MCALVNPNATSRSADGTKIGITTDLEIRRETTQAD